MFHVQWATLLTRSKHLTSSNWLAARNAAESYGYDASSYWPAPKEICGFTKDETADESFIALLKTEPDWKNDWYQYDYFLETVAALFSPNFPEIPAGTMVSEEFKFGDGTISTNFATFIKKTDY